MARPYRLSPLIVAVAEFVRAHDALQHAPLPDRVLRTGDVGVRDGQLLYEGFLRISLHAGFLTVRTVNVVQLSGAYGLIRFQLAAVLHKRQHRVGFFAVPLQRVYIRLSHGEFIIGALKTFQPFQREHKYTVRFRSKFVQEIRIPVLLRHSPVERYNNQPAIEAFGLISLILRDTVAREYHARGGEEGLRFLELFFDSHIILSDNGLKYAVILDILGRKICEDIG